MKKAIILMLAVLSVGTIKAMDHDIDAQTWCKNVVMGWNLGNSLEAEGSETSWGNPKTTKDMIKAVKAQGFNAIRIPVRWGQHCNMTTMEIDATWLARVKEVVDWCLEEDLMVIVNTHHDLWLEHYPTKAKKAELNDKLKKLWTNIATYFKDYDGRLAFAGTNEVNPNGDWGATPSAENFEVQNSFNQTFIDAVRATGGNNAKRNLIVQTMRCNPYMGLSDLIIPNDPTENRLSVEFHYYDPYSYCSGGEGSYYYWGKAFADKGEICPDGNESSMKALFSQLRKEWWDNGLGVVIGEYGCAHHYTEADRATQEENQKYYMKCLVGEARHMGFAAFVWDNNGFGNGSEKFGIFNRWNNMSVDAPFFLNGIKEGSKEEYVEDIGGEEGDPDVGVGGTVIWEGEKALDWGKGVTIEKEKFTPFDNTVTIVLYYNQNPSASYQDIQTFYGDWSTSFDFTVEDVPFYQDFKPFEFYGTTDASHITPFSLNSNVLSNAKNKGVIIHGYGVTLTKMVLIDKPSTAINTTTADETADKAIYDLGGRKVKSPTKKGLYIVGGKMILKN